MTFYSSSLVSSVQYPAVLCALACGVLASSCAPKKRTPDLAASSEPTPVPAALVKKAPEKLKEPVLVHQSPEAEPTPVRPETFDPDNPDWTLRYKELAKLLEGRFVVPAVGQSIAVKMKSGTTRSGAIVELSNKHVALSVGGGDVTLNRDALHPESRIRLFKKDYIRFHAVKQLRKEQAAYNAKHASSPAPGGVASTGGSSSSAGGAQELSLLDAVDGRVRVKKTDDPPKNEGRTGRVRQVEEYLQKNSRNPSSLRFLKWGKVKPHGEGWAVECRYSTTNREFGRTTATMLFLMRADGKVFRQVPVRGGEL